jgi:diguanylate cyclase (GGDEF)-like protein
VYKRQPFLYLGLLGVLIAQLSVSGRQIQRQLSRTAHYASLALTDPLTGLPNRRFLEGRLHDRFAAPGTALGVLLIDLDHFKTINDRYGHAVGDRVLRRVGALLRSGARPGDLVARWGGEEFVVLVETGERAVLEQLCARLRRALQEVGAGEGLPPVTVSVGAALSQEASDVPGLLRLADRRLYRAKRAGRDRLNMDDLSPHATLISLRPQA